MCFISRLFNVTLLLLTVNLDLVLLHLALMSSENAGKVRIARLTSTIWFDSLVAWNITSVFVPAVEKILTCVIYPPR